MIGGERSGSGRQAKAGAALNRNRDLGLFGRIGLWSNGDDDGVGLRRSGGGGVVGGVGNGPASRGLRGDDRENAAGAAATTAAGKRPGKCGVGIGAGNRRERGDDGRGDTGLKTGGRGKL